MLDIRLTMFAVLALVFAIATRVAAGRISRRVVLAPAVFMATRAPMLLVWPLGSIAVFAGLWREAIDAGSTGAGVLVGISGLSLVGGLALASLFLGPALLVSRAFAPEPAADLDDGERVLLERDGRHVLEGEARRGRVLVTSTHLRFVPQRFVVQRQVWSVPRDGIARLAVHGTSTLALLAKDGRQTMFLIDGAKDVAQAARPKLRP